MGSTRDFCTEVRWLYVFLCFYKVCYLNCVTCSAFMITNLTGTRSHHFRSRQAGKTSLPIALSEHHVYIR